MRTVILDGNRFSDRTGFYEEAERALTRGLTWKPGHSLDAFNDLLRGGFGVHAVGEPICIRWLHFERSREMLGEAMIQQIISVILDQESGHRCRLECCA